MAGRYGDPPAFRPPRDPDDKATACAAKPWCGRLRAQLRVPTARKEDEHPRLEVSSP
jgi:hypothetical protein